MIARVVHRPRVSVTAAFAAQGLGFATVLTHLPDFKTRWQIDDLRVTLLVLGVAVLAGVGSGSAALIAGRSGDATALRLALIVGSVGLTVVATAPGIGIFLAGLAVYGVSLGAIDASSNMQAVALEAISGRSILTSFYAAYSVGAIAGSLITAGTAQLGWSITAAVLPLAIVPLAVSFAGFLPSHPGGRASHPGHRETTDPIGVGASLPWRPLLVLGVALVLFYVADSAASTWSSIYLTDVLLAGPGVAPLALGAYQLTGLVSRFAGDHLVRRAGAVPVVRGAAAVALVGLSLVVIASGPWTAILGFAVLGVGLAVVLPLTFAAAGALAGTGDAVTRRRRADAIVARLNVFNYVGFVLGGVLTGLVGTDSLRWGFLVPLVGVAVILPLARVFARPTAAAPWAAPTVAPQ